MRTALDNPPNPAGVTPSRKRKLAAILHTDVVGFSRLMGEDEAGTHQALSKLRGAVDPLITAHGGRIVGTAGDSLLADFSSVVDALNCAVEMQRASRAVNDPAPPERRSPSPAPSASRTLYTSKSGTSSILITARSAPIASRTSPSRCALTRLA